MNDQKQTCNKTKVQREKTTLNKETIDFFEYVKYLGDHVDQCLTYEFEIKKVLTQMVKSIYSSYTLRFALSEKTESLFSKLLS